MSFFSKAQAQIRQEGFHLSTPPAMDFGDELASLIHDSDQQAHPYRPHLFDNQNFSQQHPPPSSFHQNFARQTPSPSVPQTHRSRSTSRPPSGGPARTTRSRRNNSISGTSPPPQRPHAIVIPRSRATTIAGQSPLAPATPGGWYLNHSATSEYTPDSIYSHSFPQQQYTPFSLSSPTLPPVSSLHSLSLPMHQHQHQHQHQPHSPNSPHGFASLAPGDSFQAATPHSMPNVPSVPSMHPHHPHSPTVPSMGSPSISSPLVNIPSMSGVPIGVSVNVSPITGVPTLSVQDKQAALANEKRRRRRESHNAVERRRRDNINEKISELATLIPECMLDVPGAPANGKNGEGKDVNGKPASGGGDGTPTEDAPQSPLDLWIPKKEDGVGGPGTSPPSASEEHQSNKGLGGGAGSGGEGAVVKANKGMILRKSVEYIRYLQQLVAAQGARNRELELELKQYRGRSSPSLNVNKDEEMGMAGMMGMEMGVVMLHGHGCGFTNGSAGGGGGGGGGGFNTFFGLPSMPEGEGEGEGEVDVDARRGRVEGDSGMDVEGMSMSPEGEREDSLSGGERERERERERDRGRTRGRDVLLKGKPVPRGAKKMKEEAANGNVREEMMVM